MLCGKGKNPNLVSGRGPGGGKVACHSVQCLRKLWLQFTSLNDKMERRNSVQTIRSSDQSLSKGGPNGEMDLDILRTFTVAAKLLNFRRTAEKLYISQPTVTAHVKKLEAALGCELFRRDGRGIRLTSAGRRFLPDAVSILERYDSSISALTRWLEGRSSALNIAASPLIARSILPQAIRRFTLDHPDIEFRLDIVESEQVASMVIDGQAHVGLSRIQHSDPGVTVSVLYRDPVVLVAGHAIVKEAPNASWRELVEHNTLLIKNHPGYWDEILMELSIREVYPKTLVVTDVDITKHFIEEGVGLSFLPRSAVWRELRQGRLVAISTQELQLPIAGTYLVEPTGSTSLVDQTKRFVQLLRSMAIGE